MASKGPAENRLKSYKTKGLDVSEVRRRREEEGVQLRRSRREEQYSKRRNLTDVDELEAENATFPEGTPFTEVARALFANETEQQLAALARFRKALSKFGESHSSAATGPCRYYVLCVCVYVCTASCIFHHG
ncbi:Importin subunit alpha-1 [Geodia barretti]|uniref:Importin subunit alpha-1 n=1 Tax=Geodia barretti TaxID=519541 RepID=A0AA35T8C1_GEOBA|nr:Importin subunit alpha-1 [Geodia barretti]